MSHKSDEYEDLIGFQRIMYKLANERYPALHSDDGKPGKSVGPHDIAKDLYTYYFDLVKPRGTKAKHDEFEGQNIKAIKKCVERHFNLENAYDVPGKYMYAYSKLFKVSMDYLYGNTPYYTDIIEAREICEKTGLSEKAVENLLSDEEVFAFEYLAYEVDMLVDENTMYEKISLFWDKILSSELYTSLPENFFHMASSSYLYNLIKQDEDAAYKKKVTLPSKEEFIERIDEYQSFLEHHLYIPDGASLEDLYDNDKYWCESTLRDIANEEYEKLQEKRKKLELASWGCSGQFDRQILNFFHDLADSYEVKFMDFQNKE